MTRPTVRQVEGLVESREIGARIDDTRQWRELPGGRWAIPVVAYMSRDPMPDVVLAPDGKGWKVDRPQRTRAEVNDQIFAVSEGESL
jgi:hypothetical protein